MQVTQTSSEGLKQAYKIVVESKDIDAKVSEKLADLSQTARLPGFRPGKVPTRVLKQRFGKSVLGEVLQQAIDDSVRKTIEDKALKPALQPKIEVTKFDEGSDLEYTLEVEVLPEITPGDFSGISLERLKVDVSDAEVEESLQKLADQQTAYDAAEADTAAAKGDAAVIDFLGKLDGTPFEGGAGTDYQLVLGSGQFIPGFEDQLVGVKAGDKKDVSLTFPAEYPAEKLAGKAVVFEVTVKEVRKPNVPAINDDMAVRLGLENLAQLREKVKEQIAGEFSSIGRARIKRALLDRLDEMHRFDVPPGLVDAEFSAIKQQLDADRAQAGPTAPEPKPDDELSAEYRPIAERRVRLGLLLSRVGELNNIKVGRDELSRAIAQQAQRFPGQEQQVFKYFQDNPQAAVQLQAPIFEEKVVDFILELAKVTDKTVSKDELLKDPDEDKEAA